MHIITHHFCLLLLLICFYGSAGYRGSRERSYDEGDTTFMQDFLMPGVRPTKPDEYLCTAMSIPVDEIYIVDFEPKASMDTAHHLLLFGCESVATRSDKSWNCGSMGTCGRGESQILFAWARNAPAPDIPPDVGFRVGHQANINYLVLQIHYGHIEAFADGSVDHSGLTLKMTENRQRYLAGIYLLVSGMINIPPHAENVHTDIACEYTFPTPIHPFAFRTHSHDLGRVISGYRIRNGRWQLLGKGNPQWPQAFYPMESEFEIKYGDTLAARCTFSAPNRKTSTHVGPTGQDEMCNFYMMYYTDTDSGTSFQQCMDSDPALFLDIPPGSDDPPPDPIGFDSMMHHHEPHHHDEISIPAYDHDHDLPDETRVDYVSDEAGDPDLQLTTPARNENVATDAAEVTKDQDDGESNDGILNPQDLTNHEEAPANNPAELHLVSGWPREDLGLGQVAGVAMDSKGDVHVFHRGDRVWDMSSFDTDNNFLGKGAIESDTVKMLDKNTGNVKAAWGANQFYMPHGLTIDHEDNIWLTDVALHQVFKYPAGGATKPLLTLGERLVNGKDNTHFCKPTDVAVDAATGAFFVADGYCNSRIMKFSPNGQLLMQWGNHPDKFIIPHSLTMVPEKSQVCVADREHGRIMCFDTENGAASDVFQPSEFGGRVFAIEYSKRDGGIMYAVNGPIDKRRTLMNSTLKVQGFSIDFEDGSMLQTWAPNDKGFTQPHDVTVSPDDSAVYVVEINPNAVWKFELDLGIHENDKKSALASLPENALRDDASMNSAPRKNSKNKSPVMSRAAHAATAIVVCILIVPIVCIFIVAIFVRLRDQGHLGMMKGFPRYKSTQDRFSVGNFFNKRKGFNPVTTEGSDVEDEGSWTDGSDVEEYSRLTGIRTQNL